MIESVKELVIMNLEASDRDDAIRKLCAVLEKEGYIGSKYCDAVIARENEYPTGLPSDGVFAAIPHAFSDDCKKTGTAVGILSNPVTFHNIADPEDTVDVELVFLLANASSDDDHVEALGELMECMSKPSLLEDIKNASSAEEVVDILSRSDEYEEG